MSSDRTRRPSDPYAAAEAAFKKPAPLAAPVEKRPSVPNAKELVTLRLDRAVLDHFQEAGSGWQDRINEALKRAVEAAAA